MGKLNPCLNNKKKNKRWIKGQSSSSNPVLKKFRKQAQSCFFQQNLGKKFLIIHSFILNIIVFI
jgi:ribosomal RNA-processing protein 12